jgi:hypothetical protein
MKARGFRPNQSRVDSPARLHAELSGFLRQHGPVCDERHLLLPGWMLAGPLLSRSVCCGH